jgi:hypothetical protein
MSTEPGGRRSRIDRSPDFGNLRRALLRQPPPGPVPFIELFADPGTIGALFGEKLSWRSVMMAQERAGGDTGADASEARAVLDLILRFCYENGYDYVYTSTGLSFPRGNYQVGQDTATVENWVDGKRVWQDESTGPIQSWADFEAYPWPQVVHISYRAIEYLSAKVPEGMKLSVSLGGIFENSSWLMGLESFSYALADQS